MSTRALRAANELRLRGWQIDDSEDDGIRLDKECRHCGYQMRSDSRYCQQCGAKVEHGVAETSLQDLEAAIKAANEEHA